MTSTRGSRGCLPAAACMPTNSTESRGVGPAVSITTAPGRALKRPSKGHHIVLAEAITLSLLARAITLSLLRQFGSDSDLRAPRIDVVEAANVEDGDHVGRHSGSSADW